MRRSMSTQRRNRLMGLSSILLAVAPKCPICFLAYFGIFGVATTTASAYRFWLPPLTAMWLALTVAMLAMKRNGERRYTIVAVGLISALAVFAGKFIVDDTRLVYGGIAVLVAAVLWRSWLTRSKSSPTCSPCEQLPILRDQERRPTRPAELPTYGAH